MGKNVSLESIAFAKNRDLEEYPKYFNQFPITELETKSKIVEISSGEGSLIPENNLQLPDELISDLSFGYECEKLQ